MYVCNILEIGQFLTAEIDLNLKDIMLAIPKKVVYKRGHLGSSLAAKKDNQ